MKTFWKGAAGFLLAILLIVIISAAQLPAGMAQRPDEPAPAQFGGFVIGSNALLGHEIVVYINHIQQSEATDVRLVDGKLVYSITIPMGGIPIGSIIIFKIDGQDYGIATLTEGINQTLDLRLMTKG